MLLKAIHGIMDGKKFYLSGQTLQISKKEGMRLIRTGYAVEEKEKPVESKQEDAKGDS